MFDIQQITQETVAKVAASIVSMREKGLAKATVDLSTGLTGQPLEAPAKLLVPLLSPFRQTIARETVGGSTRAFKKITAVTPTGGFFPAEGTKANKFTLTKVDDSITFRSMGRGGDVTWEADIAGRNFEDVLARVETLLLLQAMREEEAVMFGGNRTALGAPASLVVTAGTSGGAMADATYFVRVFALTMEAVIRASYVSRPAAGTNNYDGTLFPSFPTPTVGWSVASSQGTATIAGGGGAGTLTITWTANPKAVAYAVFVSTTTGAGQQRLQCIIPASKAIITATNTTAQLDPTGGDTSANTASFDGIIAQLNAAGSGAYIKRINGPLSSAVGNQIPQIAAALNDCYDRTKTEPDRLVMGWPEADGISQKLIAVSNDRVNINLSVAEANSGGLPRVEWYKSPRGKRIKIEENPNLPGGVILGLIDSVPYPDSQIPAAWKMWMGSDWVRLDYALTAPAQEIETRAYGALAGYAPSLQFEMHDIHPA